MSPLSSDDPLVEHAKARAARRASQPPPPAETARGERAVVVGWDTDDVSPGFVVAIADPDAGTFELVPQAAGGGTGGGADALTVRGKAIPSLGAAQDGRSWVYDHTAGAMVWTDLTTPAEVDSQIDAKLADLPAGDVWAAPSPLGAAARPVTDLLFSDYDTNPASTDQSAAFQAALDDAAALVEAGAAKVRIILDTRQEYLVGAPVTAGPGGQWSQIHLPFSRTATGVIQLVGMPRGASDYSYIAIGESGTVIRSTLTAAPAFQAARGIASIFGGPASFSTAHTGINAFSMIRFGTRDLTIRSGAPAPVIAGIDAGYITGFGAEGLLQFDTDQMAAIPGGVNFNFGALTVCTAPQAIPLITPLALCWYGSLIETLIVAGWLSGPVIGEMVHIHRYGCFAVPGAVLSPDGSSQPARIDYLFDWMNGYGVAQMTAQSATPQSPSVTPCPASQHNGTFCTPLEIGSWQTQTGGAAPAALSTRTVDVWDANQVSPVEGLFGGMNANGTILAVPIVRGTGDSLTGQSSRTRLRSRFTNTGKAAVGVPASGTPIRNPTGRECLVIIAGGAVTSVTVDSGAAVITGPGSVVVPPQGVIALTYTTAPTWTWQKL
jgi:hypothetical protein